MKIFQKQRNNNNKNVEKNLQLSTKKLISNSSKILDNFGWFQVRSLILLSYTGFGLGMFLMSFVFLNIVPPYECDQQSDNSSSKNVSHDFEAHGNETRNEDQCVSSFKFFSNISAENESTPAVPILFKRKSCLGNLVFNISDGNTAVSQFGLVCESAWMRPFTTSCVMIGMFFGTLFGIRLADTFGRRPTSLVAVFMYILILFGTGFCTNYWVYAAVLIINGGVHIVIYISFYTWLLEIAGKPEKRIVAAFCFNLAFGVGGITMSLISYLVEDWNWIFTVEGVVFCVALVFSWFVPEPAPWLLQKKKLDEAAKVLKTIIKTNEVDDDFDTNISTVEILNSQEETIKPESEPEELDGILLLKNKVLRRRLFLMCFIWNVAILSFYTNGLNSANLGGNAHINNMIGTALEIVAVVTTTYALRNRGRRTTLASVLILFGCVIIISPLVKQKNEIAGICLAMVGRFFAMSITMIAFLYAGEVFPTMLRSTSLCICSTSSRICGILTPFLIFAGEEVDLSIPFYVMGGIAFVAVYFVMLLPETSKSPLLNTMEDALSLKDPSFLPRLRVRSTDKENKGDHKTSKSSANDDPSDNFV